MDTALGVLVVTLAGLTMGSGIWPIKMIRKFQFAAVRMTSLVPPSERSLHRFGLLLLVFPLAFHSDVGVSAATSEAGTPVATTVTSLNGPWSLAVDPKNVGRQEKWGEKPPAGAKAATVPGIIQDVFHGYHGVAWYWRDFTPPLNPHPHGRYLLRFWQVDYLADIWVNGIHVDQHEGGEDPFVCDMTDAIKPGEINRVVVRVLNPTHEPIDGIALAQTPRRNKSYPPTPGCDYNYGGITDDVDLFVAPAVRIEDLFVRADPHTGRIHIQTNLRNAGNQPAQGQLHFTVSPAASGETLQATELDRQLPPGDTLIETELRLESPRLWGLNDPYLYRLTARASVDGSPSFDEQSTRCGFRDFRFRDGTFQLNGRRIFLKSSHSGEEAPGLRVASNPDWLRKDLLNCKVMGFNMIRFIAGVPQRYQLDLCDEIGLMVYEEDFASWCLEDSPKMAERFDHSTAGMIQRDRNHPSVVMWGLLNETGDGPVFRHAVAALPLVRGLDDSRVVMLNSGRFDNTAIGSLSNPGSTAWEDVLADQHPYQSLPHDAAVIHRLRTVGRGAMPLFLSEYGMGSAVDLVRLARQYEQWGKTASDDAVYYRHRLAQFMADWQRWNLGDTFASPEDYFRQCLAWMAPLRKLGINAIRANPNVIGYSLTGTQDQGLSGEGLTTIFRELKPGTIDAIFDAFYPLRWCLFVEPLHLDRGRKARLEAVLANEDVLAAGQYPARLQVIGPGNAVVFDRVVTVTIPDPKSRRLPPFTVKVFADEVTIDGPPGKYRVLATLQKGGAAAGGNVEFFVFDPAEMPAVTAQVVLWGEDEGLVQWLAAHRIKTRSFTPRAQTAREVILVGRQPAGGGAEAFRQLTRHIARGSNAVFLSLDVFKKGKDPLGWLPLAHKGRRVDLPVWLYHKDDWTKRHPIFEGLPAGGIMDHAFYHEVLPTAGFTGQDVPAEIVAGAIDTSCGYSSGLTVGVYQLGAGRFTLNTLRIREHLGSDPVADRLLGNMLRDAARHVNPPPADLPADFEAQLKAMGYQ